jgi:lipid A ethanolaminephosphotransferase
MPLPMPARLRPMIRVETLVLVVVAWMIATLNGGWWSAVGADRNWSQPSNWLFVLACFVALTALHFAVIAAVSNRWIVRPLLTLLVVLGAAAAYYVRTFHVILDPAMMENVLRTDRNEAKDLLNVGVFAWVLAWSLPPVAFIWVVRLRPVPVLRAFFVRVGAVAGALVLGALSIFPISRDITAFMRNQREARYLITPANYLWGVTVSAFRDTKDAHGPREPVGRDAHLLHVALNTPPHVLVLVVGETARADNFSLLGYPRLTNPQLAQLGVTTFDDVKSCGTSTEVSVPCMFSPYGRADYDEHRIRRSETLLDVLVRAGYRVRWIDNQSGCKGVCNGAGVEYEKIDPRSAPDLCSDGECWDEVLARRLQAELPDVRGDTVFVLHMMGNHGPAYFRRYPAQFRRFTPDCATAELRDCTREQVVNAYDNAILYTDHVLARIVATLAADAGRLDSAMLYVSDHGESLGEKGLYLHGIPYSIAPEQQTHVPMIVWLSRAMTETGDVNARCLHSKAGAPLSHDNLFHSVLGLLDVSTSAYREDRDLFDGCRGAAYRAVVQADRR